MSEKTRVLFLCTGNSCRSQIAEALLRHLARDHVDAFSAGTEPREVHPLAVEVMREAGIDISSQVSKGLEAFTGEAFRFIITLCARAKERCPKWPGDVEYIHWAIDDPAASEGSEAERMRAFRTAREEIRQRITLFLLANRLVPSRSSTHSR
jgi:arsenate reductase